MALFTLPQRGQRAQDTKIAKKVNTKAKIATTTVKGSSGIAGIISRIKAMVAKHLGKYTEQTLLIRDADTLHDYISVCIDNGVIAIDTETNGLDPMLDDIVGVCIYTPGQKTAYIPINHVSYITLDKVSNQLEKSVVQSEMQRIADSDTKVIMFNAKFDIRVLRNQLGVYLKCYWDCYLAARLLNENEGAGNNGLKKLHQKYVLNGEGDAFSFDDLFKGVPFSQIPITTGYLYAAHDAVITYELYLFQKEYLLDNAEYYGLQDVSWVFFNVEMPCVDVCCNMEDAGILFDNNYANELSVKYHDLENSVREEVYAHVAEYQDAILSSSLSNKLDNPINIDSPSQLQVLLYDIMHLDAGIDKKTKQPIRGTGEDILKSLNHPLCDAILKYRGVTKLLSTYIDKLPNCVNPNDGRIHCSFNQYGADTGRFSSNDPNLQNIPSHNKDIRKMFVASCNEEYIKEADGVFEIDKWCEVKTTDGWLSASKVAVGDRLEIFDDTSSFITVSKIDTLADKNHLLLYYT